MASKSQLEYWNGSAWVVAQTPANNNALVRLEIKEKMGSQRIMMARMVNRSAHAFSGTLEDAKGKLSDVFTDFMPVRVRDADNFVVLFAGRVTKTEENYDQSFGTIIEVTAEDALAELKDNVTDGGSDIKIDVSEGDTYPSLSNLDETVDRRSGIVKSIISRFSKSGNISFSDTDKFKNSAVAFPSDGVHPLKDASNKAALSHIAGVAKDDPHTSAKQNFIYDFYVDPNITNGAAGTAPPAATFNYFKRGTFPTDTPETYGLRVEYPTSGGLTRTGRVVPMMSDYGFERPSAELFTEATCHYVSDGNETVAGSTNRDKGFDSEEKTLSFELVKVRNITNGGSFVWSGKGLAGSDFRAGVDSAEILTTVIDSVTTDVGYIQYLSATSGGSTNDPEYALITPKGKKDKDTEDGSYVDLPAAGATLTGKTNTSSSFTIVERPKEKYNVVKIARLGAANNTNADIIREQAVSRLKRSNDPIVRGRFRIMQKPWYYAESSSTTVSSNTITFGGGFNPQTYGFKIGMSVVKVSSTGETVSYGYSTAVSATAVTVGSGMSASISTGDTIRLYVPVRASDSCYVVNRLVNINGSRFVITDVNYAEDNGILNTELEVVGTESGLGPKQSPLAQAIAAVTENEKYPAKGTSKQAASTKISTVSDTGEPSIFYHGDANSYANRASGDHQNKVISWDAAKITVGGETYDVERGSTEFPTITTPYKRLVVFNPFFIQKPRMEANLDPATVTPELLGKRIVLATVTVYDTTADMPEDAKWCDIALVGGSNDAFPSKGSAEKVIAGRSIKGTDKLVTRGMGPFKADCSIIAGGNALRLRADEVSSGTTYPVSVDISFIESDSTTINAKLSGGQAFIGNTTNNLVSSTTSPFYTVSHQSKSYYIYFDLGAVPTDDVGTTTCTINLTDDYKRTQTDRRGIIASIQTVDSDGTDAVVTMANGSGGNQNTRTNKALNVDGNLLKKATSGSGDGTLYNYAWPTSTPAANEILKINSVSGANVSLTWGSAGSSGVTQVSAGNGMDFSNITSTGSIVLGTPSSISATTNNEVTSTSHTHDITGGIVQSLTAGNGLTGGGSGGTVSVHIGQPSTVDENSNNTVTASSHTHNLTLPQDIGTVTAVNGSDGINVNNPTGPVVSVMINSGFDFTGSGKWTGQHVHGDYVTFEETDTHEKGLLVEHWVPQSNPPSETAWLFGDKGVGNWPNPFWKISSSVYRIDTYYSSSSRRYKENIVDFEHDSSLVYQLSPKNFTYKPYAASPTMIDGTGKKHFGYIAEEVNEILPEIVNKDPDGEPEGVKYEMVTVLLVEEIKKLKARIEVLEGN